MLNIILSKAVLPLSIIKRICMKLSIFKILYVQVLIAITIGVFLGHFYPEVGIAMKPFGDGFIKLIKMIIAPIIFCTIVTGIAGMESMKSVGKTGGIAIIYFQVFTVIALIIGLIVVNMLQPGAGMNIDPNSFSAEKVAQVNQFIDKGKQGGLVNFLMDIIPNTAVGSFTSGKILQVLFFAILFGFALHRIGEKGQPVFDFIQSISEVIFSIINMIMKVAPLGAFGAMAYTIGEHGITSLIPLAKLIICFYITCILFVVVVLGSVSMGFGFNIFKFIRYIKDELLIVLGTSSSEAVLPRMLAKMERAGCNKSVVGLVIPTGYSFNLDGTAIYLTMAAIFLAQAMNIHLALPDQIFLLIILIISSKGAAGVTGSGFIILAGTLSTVGTIPVAGLAIIFGIDRFMSEARALTNLIGNGVATIVIAKWTRQLDEKKLNNALNMANV